MFIVEEWVVPMHHSIVVQLVRPADIVPRGAKKNIGHSTKLFVWPYRNWKGDRKIKLKMYL